MKRRRGPFRVSDDGYVLDLGPDESALVVRLLGELRQLLTNDDPDSTARLMLVRLFPVAHPDDDEAEAEYQRLMRTELVESRLGAIERVEAILSESPPRPFDDVQLVAMMQSVNALRLILGTMLGVSDDPADGDHDGVDADTEDTAEYQLYAYLSWLLEHSVRAASGG